MHKNIRFSGYTIALVLLLAGYTAGANTALTGKCENWPQVLAVMQKANAQTGYTFFKNRFGKPLREYATPSLPEEYVVFFQVPHAPDSVFWLMLDTKTKNYLYWSNEKYGKEKAGIPHHVDAGPPPKVKQVKAWTLQGKDTLIVFINRYDKKGRLLEESDPANYCGMSYTYDSLGRLATCDITCGESSGNGLTSYAYAPGLVCRHFSGGAYADSECHDYNQRGDMARSVWVRKSYAENGMPVMSDSIFTAYTTQYDSKGRVLLQTLAASGGYRDAVDQNAEMIPHDFRIKNTVFLYTEFDSLLSRVETDAAGIILQREVYTYDEATHQKTNAYTFGADVLSQAGQPALENMSVSYTHTALEYDAYRALTIVKTFGFCSSKPRAAPESLQKIDLYKDGWKTLTQLYDVCSGHKTSEIYYVYTYW